MNKMVNRFIVVLVIVFSLTSFVKESPSSKRPTVKLVKNTYFVGDTIKLKLNGEFSTNGDCSASLIWDVARQAELGKWDTLTHNLLKGQLCCGLPTVRIKNSVIPFGFAVSKPIPKFDNTFDFFPGKYKLLFADKNGKLVSSKPFEVQSR